MINQWLTGASHDSLFLHRGRRLSVQIQQRLGSSDGVVLRHEFGRLLCLWVDARCLLHRLLVIRTDVGELLFEHFAPLLLGRVRPRRRVASTFLLLHQERSTVMFDCRALAFRRELGHPVLALWSRVLWHAGQQRSVPPLCRRGKERAVGPCTLRSRAEVVIFLNRNRPCFNFFHVVVDTFFDFFGSSTQVHFRRRQRRSDASCLSTISPVLNLVHLRWRGVKRWRHRWADGRGSGRIGAN
mmetsp:Transcript_37344/g.86845  ORF Transcript_37344/g.86845 Transcript_37344/m.86845 type:complete len:241 (+) Transcript_37344:153-875(+)